MIDIRLDDDQEKFLRALMEYDKEKTATGMVRVLIRDGLKSRGLWPHPNGSKVVHTTTPQEAA